MNPKYLGDSYDLVKRFFVSEVRRLGYEVVVDPMFTGSWGSDRERFHALIGADARKPGDTIKPGCALFLDPDTGVNQMPKETHVSFKQIAVETEAYALVFSFDQSFSREGSATPAIHRKLGALAALGVSGIYYDSHARFLFASRQPDRVAGVRDHFLSLGIPRRRLLELGA